MSAAWAVLLAVALLMAANPPSAAGASTMSAICDGTALRSSASTTAARKGLINAGTKVTVAATLKGSGWGINCGGRNASGSSWYRISHVNGKSAASLYGVTYVYAASGLFKAVTTATPAPTPTPTPTPAPAASTVQTMMAACDGVRLRATPATGGTALGQIVGGTLVTVGSTVAGDSWGAECGGSTVSGSSWLRITHINGRTTSSIYGVGAVYAASGLFVPFEGVPPGVALTEGIDVSHWQGAIDWNQVAAAGKAFAYIKASESTTFVDSRYADNRSRARAAGLLVGAYHFARPDATQNDAVTEADHFVTTAKPARGDLLPVLDLEVTGGLTSTALQAWTKSFLQRVYDRTGLRAALYVSPSFWSTHMGNSSWFASNGYQVLWVAHWTSGSTPTVPAANWGGHGWTFWQYSSTGRVPGISTNVDLNRFKGTDFRKVQVP